MSDSSSASLAQHISIDEIALDPLNPRLEDDHVLSEPERELMRTLIAEEGLEELGESLKRNGYFAEEPVILLDKGADDGVVDKYTVLEGNRRIASIKLLRDPALLNSLGGKGLLPPLTEEEFERLASVPALIYSNREEVTAYLGVRHISGPKRWGNYAKAKYIAKLMSKGRSLEDITNIIGDKSDAIKKLARSWVIYKQAEREIESADLASTRESFSLVNEIVQNRPLKQFLGVSSTYPLTIDDEMIPGDKIDNLRLVMSWVFGDLDGGMPVISDHRDIRSKLGPIVQKEQSLQHMINTRDVDESLEYSDNEKDQVRKLLQKATKAAGNAMATLPLVLDAQVAEDVSRLSLVVASLETLVQAHSGDA